MGCEAACRCTAILVNLIYTPTKADLIGYRSWSIRSVERYALMWAGAEMG